MGTKELIAAAKDTKTRKCIKTGCGKDATGNVDMKTGQFTTRQMTKKDSKEFCAEHGKELEQAYTNKKDLYNV